MGNGDPSYFCGFPDKASLFENPKGVWRVKQLGCKAEPDYCAERRFEDMYILQSYGAGDANNNGEFDFRDAQCMYFPINSGNVDGRTLTPAVCRPRHSAMRRDGAGARILARSLAMMRTTGVVLACGQTSEQRLKRSL